MEKRTMNQAFLIKNSILEKYRGEEKIVEIPDGVQSIGKNAFTGNKTITEVIMPDSVIEIGEGAFEACAKLRKVTVSKNLETIKASAFYKCRALKSLELPKSVKTIEHWAFAACSKLESCICDSEELEIKGDPFMGLYSDGTCKMLYDKDGFLIFSGVLFAYEGSASEVIIPNTVKKIYNGAFRRSIWEKSNLKKVVIPKSVAEIGAAAFEDCDKLEEIIVPDHVVMGERVFAGCKKLVDEQDFVILNGTLYAYFGDREEIVIPEGVTKIGERVFTTYYGSNPGNKNIKRVIFPESLQSIGYSAFENCNEIESVIIPESVKKIGERAFAGCMCLKTLVIPTSVEQIGSNAFVGCKELADEKGYVIVNDVLYDYFSSIREVVIPEGIKEISSGVFARSMLEKITLPSTLQKLGAAFNGCDRLEEITIPEGISRIESYTFSGCICLKTVHLPSSLKEIGQHAFEKCRSLQKISIPEGLNVIAAHTFMECESLEEMKLPENVKVLERDAFRNCKNLKKVQIPDGILSIEDNAFQGCTSLKELVYHEMKGTVSITAFDECDALADENGFVVIANVLWKYIGAGGDVVVPDGVKALAPNVFREGYEFQGRSRNVYREEGSLTSLTLPNTVRIIHKHAIAGCKNLKTLVLPEGLEVLGEEVLLKCSGLETIVLPSTLKKIEKMAFLECERLCEIKIPASVENIGEDAFLNCTALQGIEVETDNTRYSSKEGILYNKEGNSILFCPAGKNLMLYTIPDEVTSIVMHAFVNCVTLKSVKIPASVRRIESHSFPKYNWTQKNLLKHIEIDSKAGKEYIGTDIFTFEYGESPLVYPKVPVMFVKEQKNQLRLALAYCQHPEQYEGEWAKGYESYVKSHQKSLLKLATEQKLEDVLAYFHKLDEGNTVNGKVKKVNYKKLSDLQKVELLERVIMEGNPTQVKEVLENCKTFEFTARALGIACLFGNLEIVKMLVEHGATFTFEVTPALKRKYGVTYGTTYSNYVATYSLMLVRNGVNPYIPSLYASAYEIHFGSLPEFIFNETQVNQRVDIAEYLTQNKEKVKFNPAYVLYYAILWGCRPVAERLMALGVNLPGWEIEAITDSTLSIKRHEWLATLASCSGEQCLYTLTTIERYLEGTEKKIIFTQTNLEAMQEALSNPELLQFILEKTDTSKLNKNKMMELIVEKENMAGLDWIVKEEWIKKPAQRDKLIQFAMDNQKNVALAWLIDYKNKTADLVEEAAKEEAKMMRELTENPNSVAALKKIWTYKKLEDNTLMITSYKGSDLEIEVPATIGKNQVSVIGEWAFSEVADRVKNAEVRNAIQSVILPEGITEIRYGAFVGCKALKHITFPSTLKKIGGIVFNRCEALEPMLLPETIKAIDKTAFAGCAKFYDENGFLIIKDSFCAVKNRAIHMDCIPEGPTQMLATNWNLDMATITLPESIQVIGEGVFKNMLKLVRVNMGENVRTISAEAFYHCASLKEIVLPKNLKKIETRAFANSGLREIKIPEGVEKIGPEAFSYCRELIDVYIPASVKNIGKEIFGPSVRGIYVHTPEGSYAETYFKSYVGVNIIHD